MSHFLKIYSSISDAYIKNRVSTSISKLFGPKALLKLKALTNRHIVHTTSYSVNKFSCHVLTNPHAITDVSNNIHSLSNDVFKTKGYGFVAIWPK